jgi:dsDNA-specific endonuclease/ATPase MutS2
MPKQGTLDLHGMTEDQAMDALSSFLMKSEAQGLSRVTIIPGKGTGKLKALMLKILKNGGYPCHPEKMANGKVNEGSYTVYLE